MKRIILSLLIVGGLLYPTASALGKIIPIKSAGTRKIRQEAHPLQEFFCKPRQPFLSRFNTEKLLVLLLEFNDEELNTDNPETTGNGKFQLDPSGYPLDLGKPPHNHHYFTMQLEALKYYYRAASLFYDDQITSAGFELSYDIFPLPLPNGGFSAYTLPHSMAYYSPANAPVDLMISRFEEYFQDAFATADTDPEIIFSTYDHFMFLHAGSDWQHDIWGDTPSDIPSFFIQIGEGKEAIVDEGTVIINHACNVPETITQDIIIDSVAAPGAGNPVAYVDGYGVINAVMAHEFGHSMGFVDLYNTFNFYPGVGYYDIMDSGGFGRVGIDVTDDNNNITRYFIEGGLPALPGAWSRIVAWEDDFRSRGILKDITEIEFDVDIFLQPAENIFTPDSDLPIFLKIPLSDKEYLLIENRQVDPDGDGGTYLHDSADGRVILYPIPVSDDPSDTTATYEYDFLLPGWFDQFGAALGGGFLIWHIDEAIIFDEGNYENNTVNSDYYHRGVKIIEADGLPDIGNPFSWFWRGTEYEPYFKYRPLLEESDAGIFFAGWDIPGTGGSDPPATHNDSLAANTNPPLITNAGNPSLFAVYDISSYPIGIDQERTMSLRVGTQIFDNTTLITVYDSLCALSSPGSTGFFSNSTLDFVTFSPGGIDIHYHIYNEEDDLWFSYNPVDDLLCPQLPVLSADMNNDNRDEYLIPCDNNTLAILENNNFIFEVEYREFASPLSEPPLYIEEYSLLVVPTQDKIFIDQDSLALANARVIYNGSDLVISSEDKILFYSLPDLSLIELHDIPELASQITPVAYKDLNPIHDAVYCQNESGDIIRITDHAPTTIFHNKAYGGEPLSQLAFARFSPDNYTCLIFAAGQRVFALSLDGSLVPGFPVHLDNKQVKPASYPRVLQIRNDTLILFEDIDGSYLAVDSEGEYRPEYSMFWNQDQTSNVFVWESDIQRLYFIFAENNSNLIASYINGVEEDPIIWNGYRNNRYSLFEGEVVPQSISGNMQAYGYPNPARHGSIRIRVINAEDNINYKIFDIAGNIVKQGNCIREPQVFQDIIWNTGNISSGMYFAVIRSGNDIKRVPLAVQN